MSVLPTLREYLDAHRVNKDSSDWNLTGMSKVDQGKYKVDDDEYDTFLRIVREHIFGRSPRASSLLEKHREFGPPLIDLDFRYETGGPLMRRFNAEHIRTFVAEYVAAMVYFSVFKPEALPDDLSFYYMVKPAPETDTKGSYHKDGVHLQCPNLTLPPKYQYAIRGFLLTHGTIERLFGTTGMNNTPEDCYDVSVISRNNWFLYGACKPDKAQYTVQKVWTLRTEDLAAMDTSADYPTMVNTVKILMNEDEVPSDTLDLMQTLSIRRNHTIADELPIRSVRAAEWEELMIAWGSGKAKQERAAPPRNTIEYDADTQVIVSTPLGIVGEGEENHRVTSAVTAEQINLAYRLCRECINPERRAGEYQDWVSLAICLKNIANNDESFKVWCEITRRVDSGHKKASYSDAELKHKWNLIRHDGNSKKLTKNSMHHWAAEDNPDKYRSILSESYTEWIIAFGKDTHVNVASFVCKIFEFEFRCSVGARKGAYEWFQYPPGAHSWRHLKTPTELRARISGRVKNEYVEAGRKLGERLVATTEDGERERLDEKRKKLFQIERQLEMSAFKDNVLRECQEKFYDEEFLSHLNCDPFLIGVANGVLELNYYENESMCGRPHVHFRDGRPDDCISFQMGRSEPDLDPIPYIPYDPESTEQKDLASFFEKIYPDPILREYVLTLLSSCLEGQNKEQRFYVNQGGGSNGKSMIQILMEYTFGDYQTSLQTTVLTRKRPESGAANPDMITTKCKRYIYMGEPDPGEKLNTSRMKQLSGEDRVEARGLFSDQEKFNMMGKIFLSCNELPPVNSMDNGTWRRIRVLPHISTFKDPGDPAIDPSKHIYAKDLHLKTKLRHWRTAFLSLLVHYYDTKYLAHGLKEPECVVAASNEYKKENDLFMTFFSENFVKETGAGPVTAKEIRNIFREWKRALGRVVELKESAVFDRMKQVCGGGSTDKEFWNVRVVEAGEDLSGALITHMP